MKNFLSSIRYREAFIFQSPTLMGLVLFLPDILFRNIVMAAGASFGSFLLMASIFAVNDLADIDLDSRNASKQKNTFLEMGFTRRHMLWTAVFLAAGGLLIFAIISWLHLFTAFTALIFGLIYSVPMPKVRGKNIPVLSSTLHFGGTLLSFLLGSLTFSPIRPEGLLIAMYPSVLITAGHLIHEVEDCEEDRIAACQTNAVRFGAKPVFLSASFLFGLSFVLLYLLAKTGYIPEFIEYFSILFLIYIASAAHAYRAGLTRESIRLLKERYRYLFALIFSAILIGSVIKHFSL